MEDSLKEVNESIERKLNEGIEPISQETADELMKIMGDWNKSVEESSLLLKDMCNSILAEVRTQLAIQFVSYMEKYSNATFITRWYWKRKMQNFIKGIKDLKQLEEDVTE